ncbi:MAG: alpha/beta hydrolase [Rhodospirillaceae bacterium]|jgi:uncharacterized protein|nr:alpha/beta hydrolase [Rhodospirillaceae bacterium]MBT4044106.1 alpha/beta hydrolase [Rhodospirillaceae bacterium]MBT4691336.1 alpha/beta hydrolase [Rhodospirillaceae bacterium]MBT5081392.1 alpha/beta hydrolase [Rhodospirillaceae bacterium]MBT5522876.1 alpha/beta hydrolase [Rhodospirillaceae bacterium]
MIPILYDGPVAADLTLVLAHGAGAAMDSPFMDAFATGLGERGIRVARFEFPYMAERRNSGKKGPPNRLPILLQSWHDVISQFRADHRGQRLVIGGKSMGGRMASLLLAEGEPDITALICLSYPFHPAKKPDRLRTEHLADFSLPCLIVQGDRDPLGNRVEVDSYDLAKSIQFHWCPDGDHDLTPRKRSGYTKEANWNDAMDAVAGFIKSL